MILYLDTVICVYAVDGPASLQSRAESRLQASRNAGDQFAVSDLSWLECRVKPIRLGDAVQLAEMEAFLAAPDFIRLPMPTAVYERACRIRATHGYKVPDSLYLATAIEGGRDLFLTNDLQLSAFPDIAVEVLP